MTTAQNKIPNPQSSLQQKNENELKQLNCIIYLCLSLKKLNKNEMSITVHDSNTDENMRITYDRNKTINKYI